MVWNQCAHLLFPVVELVPGSVTFSQIYTCSHSSLLQRLGQLAASVIDLLLVDLLRNTAGYNDDLLRGVSQCSDLAESERRTCTEATRGGRTNP